MRYSDIPQITIARYSVNVGWEDLRECLDRYTKKFHLEISPDFQRDYVWTEKQKQEYLEYILKGGISGKDIYLNQRGWMNTFEGKMVLVDGKQRINAVLEFLDDKVKVFGCYYSEIESNFIPSHIDFIFHVNDLSSRKEVLQWYIDLNTGGTAHTEEEIHKVKLMRGPK